MPQVHSSPEQNLSYTFETLHHAGAVKASTVVIFEDTKHIVVTLFKSPTTIIIYLTEKSYKISDVYE